MKLRNLLRRTIPLLLLLSMLIGFLPTSIFVPEVHAAESWDVDGDGTLSILCIGNSFSTDAMQYVYQIASNLGITKIHLGNLFIGGCTLEKHWTNANTDAAAYTYYTNTSGTWSSTSNYKMSTALTSRSWDYVSMQQASPDSGLASTYNTNLTNLVSYVKGKCPSSKLVWHMTWAYQGGSSKLASSVYSSQSDMYNKIISAVQSKIKNNTNFSIVVPSGTAIQNARTSLIKDNLCRDGYHLNENIGRYIAGLTFCKALGLNISGVTYTPGDVPEGYKVIAIESATNAVATPYAVTQSAHSDVTTSAYYTLRTLSLKANSFWNSKHKTSYNKQYVPKSTESTYNKFYSTQRFTSYTLPVGSVILLTSGSGWSYRPDAWLNTERQTSRPEPTTDAYTVCSNEWWENDAGNTYVYRAFNLSKTDGSTLTSGLAATINNIFQIYVPKEYVTSDLSPDQLHSDISNLHNSNPAIPNNERVEWDDVSTIADMNYLTDGAKYLFVSDPKTTGGKSYALDPTTPRLFGTFHAKEVTVEDLGGKERVCDADPDWYIRLRCRATHSKSTSTFRGAFTVVLPVQKITATDKDHVGEYLAFHNNRWEMYDANAFLSTNGGYGAGIRPDLSFNITSDRVHFYVKTQYDSDSTSVRSTFVNPGTDQPYFEMGTSEFANNGDFAWFCLYKITSLTKNTESLYDKLVEALNYIYVDDTYFSAEYKTFLDALNEAYKTYNTYNGKSGGDTAVENALKALTDAIETLNAYNQIEFMDIPYTKRISVGTSDANCANGKIEGTYFMSRYYTGNIDYVHSFINTSKYVDTNANGAGDSYGITRFNVTSTDSYGVEADDLSHAITLRFVEGSTNGYTIQFEDRNFFNRTGTTWRLNKLSRPYKFYLTASDYEKGSLTGGISIYDDTKTYVLTCDAQDDFNWKLQKATATYGSTTYEKSNRANFHLFQCSPTTLELYRALQFIQPYCNQDEAIKRYPAELYREFLADIKEAVEAYIEYNDNDNFSNATVRSDLERMAKELRGWADTLTQADLTLSYIDIPVEILDLRADTMLIEYKTGYIWDNGLSRYTLTGTRDGVTAPGTFVTPDGYQTGLIEDFLVDGNPVYKQATVEFVADLILTDDENITDITEGLNNNTDNYNKDFRTKINTIRESPSTLTGSFADTLTKTQPNSKGQRVNGCVLLWNNVTTAHDLAYYALNNLWREVPTTDTLSDGKTYNLHVPERQTLRMYREAGEDNYTIYSDDNTVYNGEYIYNTMPVIANPDIETHTDFTPINNLGFEANDTETDFGSMFVERGDLERMEDVNFHYTLHAYGSFVYYEDQDLSFSFEGDDDVYFFINNQLVMDLGGAHDAVGYTLNLNGANTTKNLGLEDGGVYTFDMYYAERHTPASNMKFQTNIKIVDTDTLTTKGQYHEISGENNLVNNDTGMGSDLQDGGLTRVGDTVAYSFDVVNSHDAPIYDLIFRDDTLGTDLSKDIISLTNEEITYIPTDITDIELYYRTSTKDKDDNITVNSDTPVIKTVSEITQMINAANTAAAASPGASLPAGSYRVTMTNEQDLKNLLALGVPANCQISVYGFKRLIVEEDANTSVYNEMTMHCSYLPWGSNATTLNVRTLSGSASRMFKVAALSGVPNATKMDLVIDYGKPLSIAVSGMITNATGVTNEGFVGFTASGYNGEFLKSKPTDLAATWKTDCGTFTYSSSNVTYKLSKMLTKPERVYAVFALSGCTITDAEGKARDYPYVLSEISITPATIMYYETDFASDVFETKTGRDGAVLIDFNESDVNYTGAKHLSAQIDKTNGVLKGSITSGDPYVTVYTGSKLDYVLQKGDVVKLRMKVDPSVDFTAAHKAVQVFFGLEKHNGGAKSGYSTTATAYAVDGTYQYITMAVPDNCVGETLWNLRIDPINTLGSFSPTDTDVPYEIDWIYVGPDTAVISDHFYDDFTDDTVWSNRTDASTLTKDAYNGVISGTLYASKDPQVFTTYAQNHANNYVLKNGDVVKVRMKVDKNTGTNFFVFFGVSGQTGYVGTTGYSASKSDYAPTGEYECITVNVPDTIVGKTLWGIRIDPINSVSKNGNYEIDWVYVGPDEPFPEAGITYPETWNNWTSVGTSDTTPQQLQTVGTSQVYGYDAAYTNDATYSNGSSLHVVGAGAPTLQAVVDVDDAGNTIYTYTGINYQSAKSYTEVSFDFTGTGFDIIGRTGVNQGALRVVIMNDEGKYIKTVTVLNRGLSELYQIPVVSVENLAYDTYTVHVFVNAPFKDAAYPALNCGGEFYFDAVRIYNPINTKNTDTDSAYAYSVYQAHGEADPAFYELRQFLLNAKTFCQGSVTSGAVYLDSSSDSGKSAITNYGEVGPNNEVYLSNGMAVAFKIVADTPPASVDIGAKSADGKSVTLCTSATTGTVSVPTTGTTIQSATAQYYALDVSNWAQDSTTKKYYTYAAIKNTGSGILSITDIKLAYSGAVATVEENVAFVVDTGLLEAFNIRAEHAYSYINNGEKHTATCSDCGDFVTEVHSYDNGVCICGAVEPGGVDAALTVHSTSMSLESYIGVNYLVNNDATAGYDSTWLMVQTGDGEEVRMDGEAMGTAYTYYTVKTAAVQMTEALTVTLYGEKDGVIYHGEPTTWSIRQGVMDRLAATEDEAMRCLLVEMLRYGAEAQKKFGYRTDDLADSLLTEEQLAYGYQETPTMTATISETSNGVDSAAFVFENVSLESTIELQFMVNVNSYRVEELEAEICIGNKVERVALTAVAGAYARFTYDGITPNALRDEAQVTIYVKDTDQAVSATLHCSVEAIAATTAAGQEALLHAMLRYGDAAKQVFH